MNTKHSVLVDLSACADARAFAAQFPDLESAWLACERGDWLLWFAAKRQSVPRTQIVWLACQCARLALPYTKDSRVLACIETAERWTKGEATLDEVRQARRDAADAAAYAAADTAAYAAADTAAADTAAYAAADTADTAAAAAYAAATAAAATAAAAAYAAATAAATAYAAARKKILKQCAELVRAQLPNLPA